MKLLSCLLSLALAVPAFAGEGDANPPPCCKNTPPAACKQCPRQEVDAAKALDQSLKDLSEACKKEAALPDAKRASVRSARATLDPAGKVSKALSTAADLLECAGRLEATRKTPDRKIVALCKKMALVSDAVQAHLAVRAADSTRSSEPYKGVKDAGAAFDAAKLVGGDSSAAPSCGKGKMGACEKEGGAKKGSVSAKTASVRCGLSALGSDPTSAGAVKALCAGYRELCSAKAPKDDSCAQWRRQCVRMAIAAVRSAGQKPAGAAAAPS